MADSAPDPNAHIEKEAPGKFELILGFIERRFLSIVGVVLLVAGAAAYFGYQPELPRELKVFTAALVFLSPAGYMIGSYVISLLFDRSYIYLIDLDARVTDGGIYQFPFDQFKELDVTSGQLDQLSPNLFVGKDVDLENLTVDGCWRGTLSDRELLRALQKVEECRGLLEDDAKRGFAIESQAWTIIRGATRSAVRSIVDTFESGTLPDEGKGINQEIDSALEQFNLERHIEEDLEPPTQEEVAEATDPKEDLEQAADSPADRNGKEAPQND